MFLDLSLKMRAIGSNAAVNPLWLCLFALLATVIVGCGSGDRQRVAVHGKVTVAGRPVEAGSIAFVPVEGNTGLTAGATIEHGEYCLPAQRGPMPGMNRVDIYGTRKTGRKVPYQAIPNLLVDESVDVVPPLYRTHSPLRRDIQSNQGELNFRLEAN